VREARGRADGRPISCSVPLLLLFARSAFAQPAPEPPSEGAAQAQPITQAPAAQPPLPEPPSASAQERQPVDDALDVPPTLKPLTVDTPSEAAPPALPPEPLPPVRFGGRGQWVMMGSSNAFTVYNETYTNTPATYSAVGGGIGIDHFVVDNVSVGMDLEASYSDFKGYGATSFNETRSTDFAGGIRFGGNVWLGESVSWYPRLTLLLASAHSTITPISSSDGTPLVSSASQSSIGPALNLYAPLLIHPAAHFMVGFGPRIQHDFGVIRGGPYDGSQALLLSGEFVVGGWWGGRAPGGVEREGAGPAEPEQAAAEVFGKTGQVVLTAATDASVDYRTYSHSNDSQTDVTIAPGVDYFVIDGISVGGHVAIGYSSGTLLDSSGSSSEFTTNTLGVAPHVGANLTLTSLASIWLRGEVGYGTIKQSISSASGGGELARTRYWASLSAPVLLHPASHFFVGLGPFVFHELSDKDQYAREFDATELGVDLVLGGWFGAPR
jgi:hypothetical protein